MKKIIIILSLTFSLLLSADLVNWSEISFRTFITQNDEDITLVTGATANADELINTDPKFGVNWKHQLRYDLNQKWNVVLDNNLFYSDKSQENLNGYFFNYTKLRFNYADETQNLKLQFSNRAFNYDTTRWMTISGTEQTTRQNMVRAAEFQYKKSFENLSFKVYTKFRNLYYSYLKEDFDDDDDDDDDDDKFGLRDDDDDLEYTEVDEDENDLFTRAQVDYQLNDVIKLFTTAYYKDDLNDETWYNHTQLGGGVEYLGKYDFFNILRGRFTYLNNTSDRINDQKDHYFISDLRYTKRIGMNFAAFVSYENRSCYDNDSSQLLRISNQLRLQAKFSYWNGRVQDSYLMAGFKLSEESEGNSIFGKVQHNLFGSLYGTVFSRLAFERYFKVSEGVEYFLKPDKSVWLKHEYTDFETAPAQHLLFVGSTIMF